MGWGGGKFVDQGSYAVWGFESCNLPLSMLQSSQVFTREDAFSHTLHSHRVKRLSHTHITHTHTYTQGLRLLYDTSILQPVSQALQPNNPPAASGHLWCSGRALTGLGRLALSWSSGHLSGCWQWPRRWGWQWQPPPPPSAECDSDSLGQTRPSCLQIHRPTEDASVCQCQGVCVLHHDSNESVR